MSIEAMRKALNYIENTEGELGIKLSCGDALREALAAQPPAAPVETGRNRDPIHAPDGRTWYQTALDEASKRGANEQRIHELEERLAAHPNSSAGSEPVAWMCEKAIWEIVETQRIGGRWLRYLTFDRPAEAEYTRNITPLYSVSPQRSAVTEGIAKLGVQEVADAWAILESHGFPPEAVNWPQENIAGKLPVAIDNALTAIVGARDDLLAEVMRLREAVPQTVSVTDAMVNAAAREMWNDRDARHGGAWEGRNMHEVCVIQTKATARAALTAALSLTRPHGGGE
ncbi:hypothetical protein ACVIYH_009064 [Bradyrhizobium diazoefficiens]